MLMRYFPRIMHFLLFPVTLAGLWSCQSQGGTDRQHPLARQFNQQLVASCKGNMGYFKQVSNLDDASQEEDSLFSPVPKVSVGEARDGADSLSYLLVRDLEYAVNGYYADTYTREKMDVTTHGDTLIAAVKPAHARKANLLLQKILMSPDSSHIRYLETHIQERSWLYSINSHTEVFFDSTGNYVAHDLWVNTRVSILGETLRLLNHGEAQY